MHNGEGIYRNMPVVVQFIIQYVKSMLSFLGGRKTWIFYDLLLLFKHSA